MLLEELPLTGPMISKYLYMRHVIPHGEPRGTARRNPALLTRVLLRKAWSDFNIMDQISSAEIW